MAITFRPLQEISLKPAESGTEWYSSQVLESREGKDLVIGIPSSKAGEVSIKPDTSVMIEATMEDGLRRLTSTVRTRSEGPPPALVLEWPREAAKVQRRQDVRVDTMLHAEVRHIKGIDTEGPAVHGLVADISAGGARIFIADYIAIGSMVEVTLYLVGIGERNCKAKVVRGGPNAAQSTAHPYWIGVMFNESSQAIRRDVTKFVFDVQREMRSKGLV